MHGIGCGSTILGGRTTSLVTGCVARFLRESFIHQSAAPNHSLLGGGVARLRSGVLIERKAAVVYSR